MLCCYEKLLSTEFDLSDSHFNKVAEKHVGNKLNDISISIPSCQGKSHGNGVLHIQAARNTWLTHFTIDNFSTSIEGDKKSNCYSYRKDKSGNGFFSTGWTSFYGMPSGNFIINIEGNDKNTGYFSVYASIFHAGNGTVYCRADISNNNVSCSKSKK